MPIYEYVCGDCGSVIEVIGRLSDADPTVHDGWGGALRRLVSDTVLDWATGVQVNMQSASYKKGNWLAG
jgi:putative FmdB family regulatory protein